MIVLDSSFFLASVLPNRRSGFVASLMRSRAGEFRGPSLLAFEVVSVLSLREQKGASTAAERATALAVFDSQQIDHDPPPDAPTLDRIAALAVRFQLTGYDAAFLELALRHGAELATLDTDLADAATAAGLTVHFTK